MMMMWTSIFIGFMLVVAVGTGVIVYVAVTRAQRSNGVYEQYARNHGYAFDRAMGLSHYREANWSTEHAAAGLTNENPALNTYADFASFPFGRGADRRVEFVISGEYDGHQFAAFTYRFTGTTVDGSHGGIFGLVMIKTNEARETLPPDTVFEGDWLWHYATGNLVVAQIEPTLQTLVGLTEE
ncbi:hypothetical protein PQ472_03405 [Lacticaseibacillus pabuli]|uniref:Uncharacterized protein n=1 Tax=Lacticaseibacillus pabuli TaxID=3025672 RepID=A0ABY7WU33_9LACO|nr:hypothetical protein [Lacticaseibacillus sp. KACC 23028]WDF83299.1 hypothetical protein PQ472_03405 [Lacticaseibacillus sp. KACC 23028]